MMRRPLGHMKIPATMVLIFPLATVSAVLWAQQPASSSAVFEGQRVTVTPARTTPDGAMPAGHPKVCLVPSGICFTPPDNDPPFGSSPAATVVQLSANQQALLFTAIGSASGSGSTK